MEKAWPAGEKLIQVVSKEHLEECQGRSHKLYQTLMGANEKWIHGHGNMEVIGDIDKSIYNSMCRS